MFSRSEILRQARLLRADRCTGPKKTPCRLPKNSKTLVKISLYTLSDNDNDNAEFSFISLSTNR